MAKIVTSFNNKDVVKKIVLLGIGVTFIAIFLLNYYTPLYADDYNYIFSFATGQRITQYKDILPSMKAHYQTMNGRIVLHALDQLFLMNGKGMFNVINTCAYLCLIALVGYHGCGSWKKISWDSLGLTFFFLWWCVPAFGQSFLWVTGASNYLYGILFILLFLIPYRKSWESQNRKKYGGVKETAYAAIMVTMGIIAGATNENTSVAMIGMIVLFLYCYKIQNVKWHLWMFSGLVGAVCGCAFMLTAPAQQERLENAGGMGSITEFMVRGIHITMDLWSNMLIMILVVCLLYSLSCSEMNKKAVERVGFIYFTGFLLSVYSMIAVPVFVDRVWSGPIVLASIAVAVWFNANKRFIIDKEKRLFCIFSNYAFKLCIYVWKSINLCEEDLRCGKEQRSYGGSAKDVWQK